MIISLYKDTKLKVNTKIAFFPTPQEIVNIMMLKLSFKDKEDINKDSLRILDTGFGERAFLDRIIQHNISKKINGIELDEIFQQCFINYIQIMKMLHYIKVIILIIFLVINLI